MGRFASLKPRLSAMTPRVEAPGVDGGRDRARDSSQPWRKWYKTARWRELKDRVHVRDAHRCRVTGVRVLGRFPAPDSPVADHIKSPGEVWEMTGCIRETERVFWDIDNLRTVSKAYHDGQRQREQKQARRFG